MTFGFGIPFDPDGEIPDDVPEFVQEMMRQAQERHRTNEMRAEAFIGDVLDRFASGFTLEEMHFLGNLLEWIEVGEDESDLRQRISHLLGAIAASGKVRENHGEVCERCEERVQAQLGVGDE